MPAKIAVLIDAENVDPSFAAQIFSYARSLGEVTVREIYGAGISLNEWADPILENTIHTNFTLRPNKFKNSSDIALVIGAMEILASSRTSEEKKVDAVILASSDSDFSPLAVHLRAAGMDVIGMGEPGRINPMWPKACTEFVALEGKRPTVRYRPAPAAPAETAPQPPVPAETPRPAEAAPAPAEEKASAPAPKEKSAAPAEKAPKAKAKPVAVIAPSHRARVEKIRQFIAQQLAQQDGRIKSADLFRLLSALPDYKYDQQRSKRKPLDYLEKQYHDWFRLEPGDKSAYWIMERTPEAEAPAAPEKAQEAPVEEAAPLEAEAPAPQAPEQAGEDAPLSEPEQALYDVGIPRQRVAHIAAILGECKNLRDVYNRMRQAFGNAEGKEYYDKIKTLPGAEDEPDPEAEAPAGAEEEQQEAKPQEPDETEQPPAPSPLRQYLGEKGVAPETAAQIDAIVGGSPNLRVAYNSLRKAFGTDEGRRYLTLVKECPAL